MFSDLFISHRVQKKMTRLEVLKEERRILLRAYYKEEQELTKDVKATSRWQSGKAAKQVQKLKEKYDKNVAKIDKEEAELIAYIKKYKHKLKPKQKPKL